MNIAQIFQFASGLAWLLAIVLTVVAISRASRGQAAKGFGTSVLVAGVAAIVLTIVGAGLVFINPQERGVVISALDSKGYREQALQPGLRFVVPFAEQVVLYPISQQTYTMSISPSDMESGETVAARTSDGQQINVDASVIYSIDPNRVVDVHIAWQTRYTQDLVRPLARGIIRDAVSQYGVEEVVSSKRFEMVELMRSSLESKLAENGILLGDFVLRNITFSEEYANSVEQKQIAEQLAQQARFVVEQRRQEAEQARQTAQGQADAAVIAARGEAEARIIQAQAEAEALRLVSAALEGNPDLLTYQYINKLSPNIQVMLLPNDSPFLFPLPNMQSGGAETPQ